MKVKNSTTPKAAFRLLDIARVHHRNMKYCFAKMQGMRAQCRMIQHTAQATLDGERGALIATLRALHILRGDIISSPSYQCRLQF